jgi:uncharacterized protein YjbI with pentapeptide repeats
LTRADFTNANLLGAELNQAILSGANLAGARGLNQRRLSTACGDATTRLPARMTIPRCQPQQRR